MIKLKEYKLTITILPQELWIDPNTPKVLYDFEYQRNDYEPRFVRFNSEEHMWRFEELLKDAGYRKQAK